MTNKTAFRLSPIAPVCSAVLFLLLMIPSPSFATTDYARQTGFECKECHVEAIGGGQLTKKGEDFKEDLRIKGLYRPLTNIQKVIRFIIGYIHLFFAIIWFGTILYVHLLLSSSLSFLIYYFFQSGFEVFECRERGNSAMGDYWRRVMEGMGQDYAAVYKLREDPDFSAS